jgi:hypothetical protein
MMNINQLLFESGLDPNIRFGSKDKSDTKSSADYQTTLKVRV